MAQIAVSFKFLIVMLWHAFASVVTHGAVISALSGDVLTSTQIFLIILLILIMVFLPEILFILMPSFRSFVMEGIQDGDGVTNLKDL